MPSSSSHHSQDTLSGRQVVMATSSTLLVLLLLSIWLFVQLMMSASLNAFSISGLLALVVLGICITVYEAKATLAFSARQVRHSDSVMSDFLRATSHQLRTPLTGIRWMLNLLSDSKINKMTPEQLETVDSAQHYVNRMAETLDTIHNVAELESGKVDMELVDVPIKSVIDEVITTFQHEIDKKKHTMSTECSDTCALKTDAGLLKEILSILVHNAILYTEGGGEISVHAKRKADEVVIAVRDDGPGIPQYLQYKVFTKFFRAQNARSMHPNGTGLGLYLARFLTEILGGRLDFTSKEGVGTTFRVHLPKRMKKKE